MSVRPRNRTVTGGRKRLKFFNARGLDFNLDTFPPRAPMKDQGYLITNLYKRLVFIKI